MKVKDSAPSIAELNALHKETYDSAAVEYEKRADIHQSVVEKAIMDSLVPHLKPSARILDIGCAVGNVTKALADAGYEADGIDISPAMIEFAKQRLPQTRFEVADLIEYDPGYRYDAIVAFAFIHLFPRKEIQKILGRMSLLLKDEGIVYTGTTSSSIYSEGFELKLDYGNEHKRYRARWTEEELENEMIAAGFSLVQMRTHSDGVGKIWMDYIIRKNATKEIGNEV